MLPTLVIGGWLGAGKTTTINHVLRHAAGRRIAVMVNDFGELSIDADLIEGSDGEVLALAGGCVCCSFGGDLLGALRRIAQRQPAPEVALIETSGVGIPSAVARVARLAAEVQVQGCVVIADAQTLRERAADRFVGDVMLQQLRDADLLLLNKTGGLDDAALQAQETWIREAGCKAPVVAIEQGRVDPDLLLGCSERSPDPGHEPRPMDLHRSGPAAARTAAQRFESQALRFDGPVDIEAIAAGLAAPDSRVLRAKGVLRDSVGRWRVLQAVGRAVQLGDALDKPPGGDAAAAGRLLVIRLRRAHPR